MLTDTLADGEMLLLAEADTLGLIESDWLGDTLELGLILLD